MLAAAFVTMIVDITHSVTGRTLYVTSIGDCLAALPPGKVGVAKDFIQAHVHRVIWDVVFLDLLQMPVWLACGIIGALAIKLGSKPASKFGFSNR